MADDGKVGVATATTHRIVFNRAPASRRAETVTITARLGDSVVLPGVQSISCIVRRVSGQTNSSVTTSMRTVSCAPARTRSG